ncbi:hypothetical protein, partial [Aeromonas salmonicida]|uniref:hypothetical protein n=1 Tax=Aeromonas salmonicida TaxID=645 RepID=UPI00195AA9DE
VHDLALGELPTMRLVSHNSDPLSPKQCHLFQPSGTIKAQPRQDWGQVGWNITPLVGPNENLGRKSRTPTFLRQPLLGWLSLQS